MTVQKHYVIVANHDDATAYTYTNHGSALVEVKKWHNEFSGASDQDIYTDKPGRQSVSDLKSALYAVFGTFQGNNASNFSTVVASAILSSTYLM
jgi:hypothetical protein